MTNPNPAATKPKERPILRILFSFVMGGAVLMADFFFLTVRVLASITSITAAEELHRTPVRGRRRAESDVRRARAERRLASHTAASTPLPGTSAAGMGSWRPRRRRILRVPRTVSRPLIGASLLGQAHLAHRTRPGQRRVGFGGSRRSNHRATLRKYAHPDRLPVMRRR